VNVTIGQKIPKQDRISPEGYRYRRWEKC